MTTDLKTFCQDRMTPREHFQPWIVLALIAYCGSADLDQLVKEYEQYEKNLKRPPKALSAKARLQAAIRVLQEHGVAERSGNVVKLVACYAAGEEQEIQQSCHQAIACLNLPAPRFVSGGYPSLGKRR
jgi:hypothetical protein